MIWAWIDTSSADTGSSQIDQLGPEGQGPGHADALALATGELGREPVVVLRVEPDQLHDLLDPLLAVRAVGDAVDRERVPDDRADPAARVQRTVRVLEDHLHVPAERAHPSTGQPADVLAVEGDRAGGDVVQPHDAAGQGGLAAAGLADQAQGLAAADLQADVLDRVDKSFCRWNSDWEATGKYLTRFSTRSRTSPSLAEPSLAGSAVVTGWLLMLPLRCPRPPGPGPGRAARGRRRPCGVRCAPPCRAAASRRTGGSRRR